MSWDPFQRSLDKQYLRDYLETLDWDKTAPGPDLFQEVIDNTASKYKNAFRQTQSKILIRLQS